MVLFQIFYSFIVYSVKSILSKLQVYEDTTKVYLVTELLRGGELLDKIFAHKRLSEREAADVMAVLVESVVYLHRHGVIY